MPEITVAPLGAPEQTGVVTPTVTTPAVPQTNGTDKGPIPYERFEQVIRQNQELREKTAELDQKVRSLAAPVEKAQQIESLEQDKKEFWADPHAYVKRQELKREEEQKINAFRASEEMEYQMTLSQLRSSPEYSRELETKMAEYVSNHGLNGLPKRANAVRAAFEAVAGHPFGEWRTGYESTRQLKERLQRPGTGTQSAPAMMSPEEFQNLSQEEYEKDVQKYNAMVANWEASQRQ